MTRGRTKYVAGSVALAFSVGMAVAFSYYGNGDYLGVSLDGIRGLRYEVSDTQFSDRHEAQSYCNITNSGVVSLWISSLEGNAYLVERVSDGLSVSGPNSTYIVDREGCVAGAEFAQSTIGDSRIVFEAGYGSSFDFPEILPLPGKPVYLPRRWKSTRHFDYSIRSCIGGNDDESVFRQNGSITMVLNALGAKNITTAAGDVLAIEVTLEKTTSCSTWRVCRDGSMTVEDGPTEIRSTGTYMIEPQSGIVLSGAVSSERDDDVFKHLYTISLTEVLK